MALGTREILLVIRAKDQASRIIRDIGRAFGNEMDDAEAKALASQMAIGGALLGVGTVMAGTGALIVKGFLDAASAGREFERQVALAYTQTKGLGTSIQELETIVLDVGKTIGIPFEGLNRTLYDIFSSMNVNVPQAKVLLEAFAKAAVAGQVDVQDSSRSTMAIMNAYKIPIEDVNKVLDTQFEMVRLGVGTYAEFSGAIGRAIPAAVAAGQSFEDLAGMMAFLTRNGLSTAMAATSAARAMELIAKPGSIKNLHDIGVEVLDASGNFRSMADIVGQLATGPWKDLTDAERSKAFTEVFGVGTIQARRFFDVAIPNFEQLNDLSNRVKDSTGAMNDAYEIMASQGATKIQVLKNHLDALKITIWNDLKPVLEKIVGVLLILMNAWEKLSPRTQKIIILTAALGAVLLTLLGIVIAAAGAWMFIGAALATIGLTFGSLVLIMGGVILAIAALVAAGYLIYRNWDTIKKVAGEVWGYVREKVQEAWDILQAVGDWVSGVGITVWGALQTAIEALQKAFESFMDAVDTVISFFQDTWAAFTDWFGNNKVIQETLQTLQRIFGDVVEAVGSIISDFVFVITKGFNAARDVIEFFLNGFLIPMWKLAWDLVTTILDGAVALIGDYIGMIVDVISVSVEIMKTVITAAWDYIYGTTGPTWRLIWAILKAVWDEIVVVLTNTWELILNIIEGATKIITGIINLFSDLLHGRWNQLWGDIKQIVDGAWQIIWGIIDSAIKLIWDTIQVGIDHIWDILYRGWEMVKAMVQLAWWGMVSIVRTTAGELIDFVMGIPGRILDALGDLGGLLWDVGRALIRGFIDGIESMFDAVKGALGHLTNALTGWKGPLDLDRKILIPAGNAIMQGLIAGFDRGSRDVEQYLKDFTGDINGFTISPVGGFNTGTGSVTVESGAIQVTINGNITDQNVDSVTQQIDNSLKELVDAIRAGRRV